MRQKLAEQQTTPTQRTRIKRTTQSSSAGLACAGRASSEGKFGTATAENGLLLQGEWVYDGQDGEEAVRKNRTERENRTESEL